MKRGVKRRRLKTRALVSTCACAASLAACGSAAGGTIYSAPHSTMALTQAGWTVSSSPGGTVSDAKQVGFLQLHAPDGSPIDAQFLQDAAQSKKETTAADVQLKGFRGTRFGNVLVFAHPLGKTTVPANDIAALRRLLRS